MLQLNQVELTEGIEWKIRVRVPISKLLAASPLDISSSVALSAR